MVDAKMRQNAQICTLRFKNFPVAMPPNTHVTDWLQRPSPNLTLSALRRCASPAPRSGLNRPPMFVSR